MSEPGPAQRAIEYLRRSSLFSEVSEEALGRLRPAPEIIRLAAGETLIRQGDTDFDYYVLIGGRLAVFVRDSLGGLIAKGRVRPGEGVGEMALLMNEPRAATVVAVLDSELVRFPQKSFLHLIDSYPQASMAIARLTIRRLKEQYTRGKEKDVYASIAVVPLTPGIDAIALARQLAKQLRVFGPSASLAPGMEGSGFSQEPNPADAERMEEVESRNRFTVYAVKGGADTWTRHCLQRSDLVLLCVGTGGDPQTGLRDVGFLSRLDREFLGRIDLLMVHGSDWNRACRTQNWIVRTAPAEHHHVRRGNQSDMSRVARIIAGTANNLVLSGGGARAFAQIGALRAFAEAGVAIDRAGGTSMGAFAAALYCYGGDLEALIRQARDEFLKQRPARDHTLPLLSILTGKRLAAVATAICANWQIEDMPYRYFCISADLGEAAQVEHFDGSVWAALRSSCALPGVAPPLLIEGRVLVDGGVLNNLPVDVMRERFSGSLIAIDVASYSPLRYGPKYDLKCPSGFEILWDKINPLGKKEPVPNIMEVLFRAATLSSQLHRRQWRDMTDLLITPAIERFRVTDFHRFDELVGAGYRHTMEVLELADKNPELKAKLWTEGLHENGPQRA